MRPSAYGISYVKLSFPLVRDEEGFPPVDWEDAWAVDLGDDKYQVANTPFYATGIGFGDIVRATPRDGRIVFEGIEAPKGHSTIHVIVYDRALTPHVVEALAQLSCSTELSNIDTYFSIDVPPEVNYQEVWSLLDSYASEDKLDYQESALRHPS